MAGDQCKFGQSAGDSSATGTQIARTMNSPLWTRVLGSHSLVMKKIAIVFHNRRIVFTIVSARLLCLQKMGVRDPNAIPF